MNAAALLLIILTLLTGAGAVWLLTRINAEAAADDWQLRLRVLGGDANREEFLARRAGQGNQLISAATGLLWRSGLEFTTAQVGWGLLALAALLPLLWLLLGALAGSLAGGVALVSVYGVLSRSAARRRTQIIEQLPSFLENVMRVMAAGNTLEESLAAAAREAPEPIGLLFATIVRQVRLGANVETVLADAADTHQLRDLKVVALAAAINRKYGGSLRQVLKSLIAVIRTRASAARELQALTAETRFSALVLAMIPIGLSLYIYTRNRSYYTGMWADPSGRWLLISSVLLQVAGVALIWRMMTRTAGPQT